MSRLATWLPTRLFIRILGRLVIAGAACAAGSGAAQPAKIVTNGFCSPVFVNVSGPVSVKCEGVDPRAVDALNKQLVAMKLSRHEALEQANEWAERYHGLQKELEQEPDGSELAKKAEEALHQGNLDEAVALFKQLIATKDAPGLDNIARHYYEAGLSLEMDFKTPEALQYLETAQRVAPDEPKYTLEYAEALSRENRLADARAIFEKLVPQLHDLTAHDVNKYGRLYLEAAYAAGELYSQQGDLDKAIDAYNQAFGSCMALGSMPQGPLCDLTKLNGILASMGEVNLQRKNYPQAEQAFKMAYLQYQQADKSGGNYHREEASMLSYLGYVYVEEHNTEEAEHVLDMAMAMDRLVLDQKNPDVIADTAGTELIAASLESNIGQPDKADSYFSQAAEEYRGLVAQDPDAYTPRLEHALYAWSQTDLGAKRYAQAGAVCQEMLPIVEKLAAASPPDYLGDLADTYNAFAQIHSAANESAETVRYRKLCADTYRKMDQTPAHLASLATALIALAWDADDAKDIDLAHSSIDESEQIWRGLYKQDAAAYGDGLGEALVFQALLAQVTKGDCGVATVRLTEATQVSSSPIVVNAAQAIQAHCKAATPDQAPSSP
jgi:tetratricopeptide (TPR) repeat protein